MRPGFTLREALLNSSEFLGEKPVYRAWMAVKPSMNALKNRPIPAAARNQTLDPSSARRADIPTTVD